MAVVAWHARCQACGAIGSAANSEAWRYVQLRRGDWWFQCCQQCVRDCVAGVAARASSYVDVKMLEQAVSEDLASRCEQRRLSSSGRRDFEANQRRRLH